MNTSGRRDPCRGPAGLGRGAGADGRDEFTERYGPWALIAGASEGLGAAFARALGERGINLVLVARRKAPLEELAAEVRDASGVKVCCYDGDLAEPSFLDGLQAACADLEVGLLICNAAQAPIGEFASRDSGDLVRVVDVNVRAPMLLLRAFLPGMTARERGGAILMTSFTGNLGTPKIAGYAASKAFLRVLGESLWYELKDGGVDVVACSCSAVRTPGYNSAAGRDAPGTLDPDRVVDQALRALGRKPVVFPGFVNRAATIAMTRLLPRRTAIGILARSTEAAARLKDTKGE